MTDLAETYQASPVKRRATKAEIWKRRTALSLHCSLYWFVRR